MNASNVSRRPWYLVAAMCLTWVVGVFGATSSCSTIGFLRGCQPLPEQLQPGSEQDAAHPSMRFAIIWERTRLEALGDRHRVAFPLSAGKLLLNVLLVIASGAVLTRRPQGRVLALQTIGACAALALVDFALMASIRDSMATAVAQDALEHGMGALPELGPEESLEVYRSIPLWTERFRFALLEFGVFGGAAVALTRQRTKEYFAALLPPPQTDDDQRDGD